MSGSTSAYTPRVAAGVACAAGGGTGTVPGSVLSVRSPGKSGAPVPVLPPQYQGTGMDSEWPLQDFIELGALPGGGSPRRPDSPPGLRVGGEARAGTAG